MTTDAAAMSYLTHAIECERKMAARRADDEMVAILGDIRAFDLGAAAKRVCRVLPEVGYDDERRTFFDAMGGEPVATERVLQRLREVAESAGLPPAERLAFPR
jgi:hypothetical protein